MGFTRVRALKFACARTTRKEFTAEDDDLVLRYIAAYDPEKKRMNSKSFYTEMVSGLDGEIVV